MNMTVLVCFLDSLLNAIYSDYSPKWAKMNLRKWNTVLETDWISRWKKCFLDHPDIKSPRPLLGPATPLVDFIKQWSHQLSSVTQSCPTLCNPRDYSMPGLLSITSSRSLLKLMSIESVMPSNHLILCHPLLLLPSIFPSIRIFSNQSALRIRWPKYWSFSFSISPSNEYSGLIFFRTDWLDLLAVQGTLRSLLQPDSSKASIQSHTNFSRKETKENAD